MPTDPMTLGLSGAAALLLVAAVAFLVAWCGAARQGAAQAGLLDEARRVTATAQIGLAAAEARLSETRAALEVVSDERDAARDAAITADTAAALARQQAAQIAQQMQDWTATKAEFLQSTRSAVLTTAQELSTKLIEDHKRESAEAKVASAALVQQTTENLLKGVAEITQQVAQLKGQVGEKGVQLDTVLRALSSPGGAGYYAEIGLANTLKTFGLVQGRDFALQHTVYGEEGGRRLRPDAVVFLPGNAVLVIDAKASKFLLDLAAAEGTEHEAAAYQNLARTMNQHLRDLAAKDYRAAIQDGYRKAGGGGDIARVISVMYLPNEAAIEKLGKADSQFIRKAADAQIIPAGPAGLACVIGFASVEISLMRQIENQEKIVDGSQRLIDALSNAIEHAAKMGRGIKSAADHFSAFAASVNGRLLPRARELGKLGLRPQKPVPGNLGTYQVLAIDTLIEGEAAEQAEDADGFSERPVRLRADMEPLSVGSEELVRQGRQGR
ncbi:MAG TPA: DNA recombination protein RmuC [Stellaceae bacterium]|nr:DNA recombination protein RmuC [Stellaceae bacterium]